MLVYQQAIVGGRKAMVVKRALILGLVAAAAAAASWAAAQTVQYGSREAAIAAGQTVRAHPGKATFEARCAACHENPNGENRAPPTNLISRLPKPIVMRALTSGPMVPMTQGLSQEEVAQVADYIWAIRRG